MYNWFLQYLLEDDPQKNISRCGIKNRRFFYPLFKHIAGPFCGIKGNLVRKESLPKGPKIFAVTHTNNAEDIAWALSFAGESSYLFCNGYNEIMYTFDGIALWLSGLIYVDRYSVESRKASIRKAERVLGYGGNIMIFPEGVWNMSENLLVRKLYQGIYLIAVSMKVPIVPIATMVYGKKLYAIRGEAFYINEHDKESGLVLLRDSLASMKWELMEQYGKTTREELLKGQSPEEYWNDFIQEYISTQKLYVHEQEKKDHYLDSDDKEFIEVCNTMEMLKKKYSLFNNA